MDLKGIYMGKSSCDGSDLGSDLNIKGRNQKFGKRLQEKRLLKGLTQKELASVIAVNKNSIQRWESGEMPSGNALIALSELFGCTLDWLLKGRAAYTVLPLGAQISDEKNIPCPSQPKAQNNVIESKHADVVRRFVDKSYAMDLNLSLVELERMSPEAYKKVGVYIKGVVDGVRMVTSESNITGIDTKTEGNNRKNKVDKTHGDAGFRDSEDVRQVS